MAAGSPSVVAAPSADLPAAARSAPFASLAVPGLESASAALRLVAKPWLAAFSGVAGFAPTVWKVADEAAVPDEPVVVVAVAGVATAVVCAKTVKVDPKMLSASSVPLVRIA